MMYLHNNKHIHVVLLYAHEYLVKYQIVINRLFHDDEITFSNRAFVGADNPHEKTPDGVIRRVT